MKREIFCIFHNKSRALYYNPTRKQVRGIFSLTNPPKVGTIEIYNDSMGSIAGFAVKRLTGLPAVPAERQVAIGYGKHHFHHLG